MNAAITERYQPGRTAIMNPGSLEDWPLAEQDRLDCIKKIHPPGGWKDQVPRTLIQPGYKKPEKTET